MKPIACALKVLEGNKYTFGIYLPVLFGLRHKLDALQKQTLMECDALADALSDGFNKRFGHLMKLNENDSRAVPLYIAMIANPQFKMNFMSSETIPTELITKIRTILFNAGKHLLVNSMNKGNL